MPFEHDLPGGFYSLQNFQAVGNHLPILFFFKAHTEWWPPVWTQMQNNGPGNYADERKLPALINK